MLIKRGLAFYVHVPSATAYAHSFVIECVVVVWLCHFSYAWQGVHTMLQAPIQLKTVSRFLSQKAFWRAFEVGLLQAGLVSPYRHAGTHLYSSWGATFHHRWLLHVSGTHRIVIQAQLSDWSLSLRSLPLVVMHGELIVTIIIVAVSMLWAPTISTVFNLWLFLLMEMIILINWD